MRFFALGGSPFQTKKTYCRPLKQIAVGIHNAGSLCTIEHIMCSLYQQYPDLSIPNLDNRAHIVYN